jgi:TolB-like protein
VSFFEDLKRRNVIRVAAAYAIVGWLAIQVAETVFPLFGFDEGPARIVVILLAIGFPLTLIFSWVYEFTPDGLKLERDIDPSRSSTQHSGKKLDRTIIVALALALGYFAIDKFILDPARDVTLEEIVAERVRDEMLVESNGDRSIAVLPFEDISPGGDQAYFGNGIADELRLELQRLDGLRVAGRTSSIAFAQEHSKTIGETLNVDTILEGSIRKEGNRVRITVQLTHVADGFTIWSESYNRELANIFEMQEEIATSVAGALGVRLGVGAINAFRGAGTRNAEAYEAYLQSQNRNLTGQERMRLLERAIELDPNYAAAWSMLGRQTLGTSWGSTPDQASEIIDRAYQLVLRGVQLNPESAVAQTMLSLVRHAQLDWIGAEQGQTRAIELLADRPSVQGYAGLLTKTGRTAYALRQYSIAYKLEPLGGRPPLWSWHANLAQGRIAEAKEISNWQSAPNHPENNLDIAFNERDPEALKAAIRALPKTNVATIMLYAPVLTEFDSPERILSILQDVYSDENLRWPRKLHDIAMFAAYFGDPQFALKVKGQEVRVIPTRLAAVWYPVMSEVRQLPEFKQLVTDLNLVEYWRAYGWADACKPLDDNDFTCI